MPKKVAQLVLHKMIVLGVDGKVFGAGKIGNVLKKRRATVKEISVVYTIGEGCVTQKDRELETLAARFNGDFTSSGCVIPTGERDMQFVFGNGREAKQFKAEAAKLIAGWADAEKVQMGSK